MIVEYYESSALVGVGKPGQPVNLNHLHKRAWQLFTRKESVPRHAERPFIFRADPMVGGQWLFTLRSAMEFPGSRRFEVELEEGARLSAETPVIPYTYRRVEGRKDARVTPPDEEWDESVRSLLERRGLWVSNLDLVRLRTARIHHRDPGMPQLMATFDATITDPVQVASHWSFGLFKMRAYGQGLLTPLPSSETVGDRPA